MTDEPIEHVGLDAEATSVGLEHLAEGNLLRDARGKRYPLLRPVPGGLRIDHEEFGFQDWGWHALTLGMSRDDPHSAESRTQSPSSEAAS
jgi:hypothetical protein